MTIFYFCPHAPKPVGGIKQIHRHVESLNSAGIDAFVLTDRAEPPKWFASSAPLAVIARSPWRRVAATLRRRPDPLFWLDGDRGPDVELMRGHGPARRAKLVREDIVVLPEFYGRSLRAPAFGARMVIFNQNAHYTYLGFGAQDRLDGFPYLQSAMAVITVSRHNRDYIAHAFPGASVYLTPNGVDTDLFRPLPKQRQIAYMPRKLPMDLVQVLQIVRGRGHLSGWNLCAIDRMHEAQVTQALGESAVFLSSCAEEGFGLPPLEAAACACAVVGYTGYAAREFMGPDLCHPVDQGDVLGFARTLERVLAGFDSNGGSGISAQARAHGEFVRRHYSRQVERDSVLETWAAILGGRDARRETEPARPSIPAAVRLSEAA